MYIGDKNPKNQTKKSEKQNPKKTIKGSNYKKMK